MGFRFGLDYHPNMAPELRDKIKVDAMLARSKVWEAHDKERRLLDYLREHYAKLGTDEEEENTFQLIRLKLVDIKAYQLPQLWSAIALDKYEKTSNPEPLLMEYFELSGLGEFQHQIDRLGVEIKVLLMLQAGENGETSDAQTAKMEEVRN